MKKRSFTKQFKLDAIQMAQASNSAKTARELGISPGSLAQWQKKYELKASPMSAESELLKAKEEIRVLRLQNFDLKAATKVLKSALGFISQDQRL